MTSVTLPRRSLLIGASAVGLTFRSAGAMPHDVIDLTYPADNLRALVKLRGNATGSPVFFWYSGRVTGFTPGEASKPLYHIEGLIRSTWTEQEDGSYMYLAHDMGFVGEVETGEPVVCLAKPYTGETVQPIDTRDGPLRGTYTVHGVLRGGQKPDPTKKLILPWTVSGDDLWIETDLGFTQPNPLQPNEWPKASSGETIQIRFQNTYKGRMSELSDPNITSAPATAIYAGHTSWPPWLLMGQTPGFISSKAIGRKLANPDEISPVVLDYIEKHVPDFLSNTMPWTENANGWEHYKHERKPLKG